MLERLCEVKHNENDKLEAQMHVVNHQLRIEQTLKDRYL